MLTVIFVPTVSPFHCTRLEEQGIHFFNGFWCGLLPVKSFLLNDLIKEWVLPLRSRRSHNPGVQAVVLHVHHLHCIQSGSHNSPREFLRCPFWISPVDFWDNVTLSKLCHEINAVALKYSLQYLAFHVEKNELKILYVKEYEGWVTHLVIQVWSFRHKCPVVRVSCSCSADLSQAQSENIRKHTAWKEVWIFTTGP